MILYLGTEGVSEKLAHTLHYLHYSDRIGLKSIQCKYFFSDTREFKLTLSSSNILKYFKQKVTQHAKLIYSAYIEHHNV